MSNIMVVPWGHDEDVDHQVLYKYRGGYASCPRLLTIRFFFHSKESAVKLGMSTPGFTSVTVWGRIYLPENSWARCLATSRNKQSYLNTKQRIVLHFSCPGHSYRAVPWSSEALYSWKHPHRIRKCLGDGAENMQRLCTGTQGELINCICRVRGDLEMKGGLCAVL